MTVLLSPFQDPGWPRRWAAREPVIDAVVPHLLDALAPGPGERILDVGAGTGSIAFPAAAAGAEVVAVDISAPMIAFTKAIAVERQVTNATFLVADAASDTIPGAPFDAATSLFGVMFFLEPVSAFRNIRRHVRPGARFVFACWTDARDNPLHPDALTAEFAPERAWPLEGHEPGPFSLADVHHTRHLLANAGFHGIRRRRIDVRVTVPRHAVLGEELVDHLDLEASERARAMQGMAGRVAPYEVATGVRVPLSFQLYWATA